MGSGETVERRILHSLITEYILETDERIEMPAKAEIRKTFMIN